MHRRYQLHASFGGEDASQAHHLGAIGLHGEIAKGSKFGAGGEMQLPAECRGQFPKDLSVIANRITPMPKLRIDLAMMRDQMAGFGQGTPYPVSQSIRTHAELNAQDHGL